MDTPWLKTAKAKFEEFQRELWAEHEGDSPSGLWHYTPEKGFVGIIGSRTIRASDIGHLNDPTEGKYSMALLGLLAARKSVPSQVANTFRLSETLFGVNEFWHQYVVCFSEEENSKNQWANYADKGKGFALVIDYERLLEGAPGNYAVLKILYDSAEQEKKTNSTIDHVIDTARELNIPKRDLVEFWLTGPGALSLMFSGLHIKDPCRGNHLEREWRVLMLRPDRTDANRGLTPSRDDTYYLDLRLAPGLLTRVVLGSNCDWSLEETQSFLGGHGFPETNVERAPRTEATTSVSPAAPRPPYEQDS